jgi:hypothetical protein
MGGLLFTKIPNLVVVEESDGGGRSGVCGGVLVGFLEFVFVFNIDFDFARLSSQHFGYFHSLKNHMDISCMFMRLLVQ